MNPASLKNLKNRLATKGADHLSTEELLAILLEKNCVTNLLTMFDGNIKEIFSASIEEFMEVRHWICQNVEI